MQRQSAYKVHLNTISNGELSDPLCESDKRGLTFVRLPVNETIILPIIFRTKLFNENIQEGICIGQFFFIKIQS